MGLENFQVREPEHSHMPLLWGPNSTKAEAPLFGDLTYVSVHLTGDSYSFFLKNKLVI